MNGSTEGLCGTEFKETGDDYLFVCECGCDYFTYVDSILRCPKCKNKFKLTSDITGEVYETWMKRLVIETGEYTANWEKCPQGGYGR